MSSLFVDTTHTLTIGLLDESLKWIHLEVFEGQKGSAQLHYRIFEILEKARLTPKELKTIFHIAGPGSYTGMRVSEGLKQIFSFSHYETYSFYHYQVPWILGIHEGAWLCDAFKGEHFVYKWKGEETKTSLNSKDKTDIELSLFSTRAMEGIEVRSTLEMIKENPERVFSFAVENKVQEPVYYFRSLDDEFQRKGDSA